MAKKRMTRKKASRILAGGKIKGKKITVRQKKLFKKFASGETTRSTHARRRKKRN